MPYQAFIHHVKKEQSQNDISGLREPGIPWNLAWFQLRGAGTGSVRGPGRCRTLHDPPHRNSGHVELVLIVGGMEVYICALRCVDTAGLWTCLKSGVKRSKGD